MNDLQIAKVYKSRADRGYAKVCRIYIKIVNDIETHFVDYIACSKSYNIYKGTLRLKDFTNRISKDILSPAEHVYEALLLESTI